MKKNYTKLFSILCLGLISVSSYAQGTWQAITPDPSPGATIAVGTELGFGITGLTVMNTAPEGVTQKSDAGAPADGIFTPTGILQANTTNASYYAFKPASSGVLKVACKIGNNKPMFIYELAETDLATAATSGNVIASGYGTAVTATLSDGSAFTEGITFTAVSPATNTYTTFTFNVTGGKVYAIGCTGSKLMLRGVDYTIVNGTPNVLADKGISFDGKTVINSMNKNIEIYNVLGKLIGKSSANFSMSELPKGIYIVRAEGINGAYKFTK